MAKAEKIQKRRIRTRNIIIRGFLVLAFVIAQRTGRRIQELERRTRLIAAGDFGPMPLPGRNDELRDLGASINEMAQ